MEEPALDALDLQNAPAKGGQQALLWITTYSWGQVSR